VEAGVRALLALFADFHLVDLLIRKEAEARGIRMYSLELLYMIDDAGSITPTELATETGLPPTTIRRWLDELERRGQINRRANPDDGRSFTVALTQKGKRARDHAAPAMQGAIQALEGRLDWKIGELDSQLHELKQALQDELRFDAATGPDDRRRFWVDEDPPAARG
jgi:DNA-binding MarR family transcriptional regulator